MLDKRYKILSVIGEGGMSVVFKARDLTTDRNVAIKVLNESSDPDGQAVKLFMNESRAISMLSQKTLMILELRHINYLLGRTFAKKLYI